MKLINKNLSAALSRKSKLCSLCFWLVHYDFFRPHMGIDDNTPAEEAGIKFPFNNWKDVVEQPYHTTSRIKMVAAPKASLRKVYKPRISNRLATKCKQNNYDGYRGLKMKTPAVHAKG